MPGWIEFNKIGASESGKTDVYSVVTKGSPSVVLGLVKWYSQWRRYVFIPKGLALFDAHCLREIADTTERLSREHSAKYKGVEN